ncbi:MAG: flagellar hook capping protein [Rhodospirillales bacterium 20-64-7]|nr:MAG: flagellar hook capping protein [Rhodospirillales bacterium 20-64-7]
MTSLAIPSASSNSSAAASTTAFSGSAATSSASSAASLTQSDFLQLLTAQLKYQSPSSPADPTQLASEFAAISEVDGINQLNTQVSNIKSSTAAGQMAQAASLVGKQVAVSGDALTANAAGSAQGAFSLSSAAANVNVTVTAPNGTVAGTLKLGALAAGQQDFKFSGGNANTQYTYNVTATGTSGSAVAVSPYSVYTVQGVNVSGTTPTLNVAGDATAIPVSSIQTVLGGTSS